MAAFLSYPWQKSLFMTIRQYIFIMTLATALCWVSWGFVIKNVDPFQASALSFVFFYISLLLALVGTISIFVFSLRYFFSRRMQPMFRFVQQSFHEAIVFSVALVTLLYLQGKGLLFGWIGLTFVLLITIGSIFLFINKNHAFRK